MVNTQGLRNAANFMRQQTGADTSWLRNAADEIDRLRKGIQDYLDGDYKSSRSYRPGKCPHGLYYYNDCENCIDDHFHALLKGSTQLPSKSKP